MSYSINMQGTWKELEEQAPNLPAPPEDQIEAASAALIVFSHLDDHWKEVFGVDQYEDVRYNINISGHVKTAGTANSFINIRVEVV